MSVDIKLGNDIINGVNYLKVKNANNPNELITFAPTPFDLNIHYSSTTPPEDTSKLWVKTDNEPEKVLVEKSFNVNEPNEVESITSISLYDGVCGTGRYGDYIYIFTRGNGQYIKKYNILTGALTNSSAQVTNAPSDLFCSTVYKNFLYIFATDYSYKFDMSTETLTSINYTGSFLRYAACSCVGDYIYIFPGGSSNNYYRIVRKFNPATDTDETIQGALLAFNGNARSTCVVGTDIYVFGGEYSYYSNPVVYYNTIQKFDTTTNIVSTLSVTLPTVAAHITSSAIGTDIYLFGGQTSGATLNTILKFDSINETITTLSQTLVAAKVFMSPITIGTDIYLFGGSSFTGFQFFSTVLTLIQNYMLIVDSGYQKSFEFFSSNFLDVRVYPQSVYLGDSNNEAQKVDAALYNSSTQTWENI